MRAIYTKTFGGPEVLHITEVDTPSAGRGEVLVAVRATALNRADLLQRRGFYPPPPGASDILGLEIAGEVIAVGPECSELNVGDRVCALLPGGGYAEYAVIPEGMAMKLPASLSFTQGAAIPEVFLTAYLNLFWLGHLRANENVLIHAGASGVGTAAIQLVQEAHAVPFVTAGSEAKLEFCLGVGAKAGWNYKRGPFVDFIRDQTSDHGADIIMDFVGANYWTQNLNSLAVDGRLIIIGTLGGTSAPETNLGLVLSRRLQIIGTALRSQSAETKITLTQEFWTFAKQRFEQGSLRPIIDKEFDWRDVQAAHAYMESNQNTGKIILAIQ